MADTVDIIEIGERPSTGVSSRPFHCRGSDGFAYFVKLNNALAEEKIYEWVFGFLADQMGLPTPQSRIVKVTKELSRSSLTDTAEFGFGHGYGSREFENSIDIAEEDIANIEKQLRADVLLFDWWIRNEDRKLGTFGGNPNILKNYNGDISIIDHGNAIDPDFNEEAFFQDHAFRDEKEFWSERENRQKWLQQAGSALERLPDRWDELHTDWTSVARDITFDETVQVLNQPFENPDLFWKPFVK